MSQFEKPDQNTPNKSNPHELTAALDHITGHRRRMRDRLLKKGAETLTDLELLEMILYGSKPRGDTKPIAKTLMRHFGSLSAVLRASIDDLRAVKHVGDAAIVTLKLTESAALHLSHSDIKKPSGIGILGCREAALHQPVGAPID